MGGIPDPAHSVYDLKTKRVVKFDGRIRNNDWSSVSPDQLCASSRG